MSLNFAPYSSPPGTPRASTSLLPSSSTAAGGSTSGGTGTSRASRPKSPWFSVGSYQSGARASDLNSTNAISSSSSSQAYPSGSGDVLWDAENGGAGGYEGSNSSSGGGMGGYPSTAGIGGGHDQYETVFGWRVDVEAAAGYALGPLLAIVLLILETKNDYVRFHAWQSLLLGAGLAILHLILAFSHFLTVVLVLIDIAAYGQLAYRAFRDGDTLERYFLPRIGELAHQWTENE